MHCQLHTHPNWSSVLEPLQTGLACWHQVRSNACTKCKSNTTSSASSPGAMPVCSLPVLPLHCPALAIRQWPPCSCREWDNSKATDLGPASSCYSPSRMLGKAIRLVNQLSKRHSVSSPDSCRQSAAEPRGADLGTVSQSHTDLCVASNYVTGAMALLSLRSPARSGMHVPSSYYFQATTNVMPWLH